MSRFLITLGIVLVAAGLLWPLIQKAGLGHLPGDFSFQWGNLRLYLPLGTSLVISAVISAVLWLVNR